ncbi:MAG: DUF2911 domain-containing protein [Chryseolinea sp.]
MKKKSTIIIVAIIVTGVAIGAYLIRPLSPTKTESLSSNGLDILVSYSAPYKKGRLIFGEASQKALVPFGLYWRLGANKATEITFNKDITFAGKTAKSGSYRMYTIPREKVWEIILNRDLGKSGAQEPDRSLDILIVEVEAQSISTETEQFTIDLEEKGSMIMMRFIWDRTEIAIPIQH